MVDVSDTIAVPKGTCIPFKIGKAIKSVKLKLSPRLSSKQKHDLAGKEPKIVYEEESSSDIHFESNMNKVRSFVLLKLIIFKP